MCRAEKQHIDIIIMTHINKNLKFHDSYVIRISLFIVINTVCIRDAAIWRIAYCL